MSQDPAAQLILSKWITDRAKEWETEAKQRLGLLPGERKAAVVNGQVLGHVSMVKGRTTGSVANAEALLAYVKAHHPTEVEQVVEERIRPAFLKSLLDDAAKKGAFIDTDGVVIDGLIDVTQGSPYPMRKLSEDADILIAGLMAKGALGVSGLKEIEEGK